MDDAEMLDWIDSLEDFDLGRVEAEDGTLLWEAEADSLYVGHGARVRDAIAECRVRMGSGRRRPNLTFGDMANGMGPAFGLPRRPAPAEEAVPAPETQASIGRWARETFPGGDDLSPRHCIRLLEEVAELCYAAGCDRPEMIAAVRQAAMKLPDQGLSPCREPEPPAAIAREMADCEIVLRVIAERRGVDLQAEVDAKMQTNRSRRWAARGDGTGYHVRNGGES